MHSKSREVGGNRDVAHDLGVALSCKGAYG